PPGEISAAIQTLLSMTSRSTFIREQLVQCVLVHALSLCVFPGALHRVTQSIACHTLASCVTLGRDHHHRRASVAGDADRLPLGGLHDFPETVLGFQGGNTFHKVHNSYYRRNGQLRGQAPLPLRAVAASSLSTAAAGSEIRAAFRMSSSCSRL